MKLEYKVCLSIGIPLITIYHSQTHSSHHSETMQWQLQLGMRLLKAIYQ